VKLDLQSVLLATLQKPNTVAPPPTPQPTIDRMWKTQDVGPAGAPGSSWQADNTKFLKGTGAGIGGTADSFYFVYQQMWGDGQIIAHLEALPQHLPHLKAGLMLREKFNERDSKTAFFYFTPVAGGGFALRRQEGDEMISTPVAGQSPNWLRLVRIRDSVTAYQSPDGKAWTQVGESQELHMEGSIFAGMAVCSGDPNALAPVTFEHINLMPGRATPSLIEMRPLQIWRNPGVVLRNGSVLLNAEIESIDDRFVHLRYEGKPLNLGVSKVARLMLTHDSWQYAEKVPPLANGVLLVHGDFLEGELQSISGGRLQLNSVVLGPKTLTVGSEAIMVRLHEVEPSACAWEVHTTDGAVFISGDVRIDRDQLAVEDQIAGSMRIAGWQVASLNSGLQRAEPLGSETPVVIQSGSGLTYNLNKSYRFFVGRISVPEDRLPSFSMRLTVLVDGRQVYQSPALIAGDAPVNIGCSLEGARQLVFRVETVPASPLPCEVVLEQAMLVK
jgi:hypothetical protein